MKKNLFSAILALCLLVLVIGTAPQALAEEITADIFYLNETSHMLVTVEFTAEAPAVRFLAPNGTVYDDTAIENGLMYKENTENSLVYRIPNAPAGQWQIVYDKGTNEKLGISWVPYAEPVKIESFTFVQNDNVLETQLKTRYINDTRYDYTVSAILTDENGNINGTKELKTGTAVANEIATFNVDISKLPTFDSYQLMVQVVLKDGIMQVEDSMIATEAFSFTNENMPEPLQGVYLEIGVDDETLLVDWTNYAVSCSSYTIAIFGDETPIYGRTFDKSVTSTQIPLDPAYKTVKVQISYITGYNNSTSQILTRTVDLSNRKAVSIDAKDATSNSNVKITYDFTGIGDNIKTVVKVNETAQETTLSGSGTMTAALEMFDNELYLYWYLDADTVFVNHRTIYYDNIAPLLVLPELTSNVSTSDATYVLVGYTNPGCTVTVGGQTATLDETGGFSVKLPLQPGTNSFTVTAKNALGNSSTQAFSVVRSVVGMVEPEQKQTIWTKLLGFLPMILTFVMSILLMLFALIVPKFFLKRKENKGLASAIVWLSGGIALYLDIIAAGFAGWSIYRYVADCKVLNSMVFFEAANSSVSESYKMLVQNARYKETMILWICIFGGLLLVGIGLLILSKFLDKNRPPKAPKKPAPQPEAKLETKPEEPFFQSIESFTAPAPTPFMEPVDVPEAAPSEVQMQSPAEPLPNQAEAPANTTEAE